VKSKAVVTASLAPIAGGVIKKPMVVRKIYDNPFGA
jgi:hypothetical protein